MLGSRPLVAVDETLRRLGRRRLDDPSSAACTRAKISEGVIDRLFGEADGLRKGDEIGLRNLVRCGQLPIEREPWMGRGV